MRSLRVFTRMCLAGAAGVSLSLASGAAFAQQVALDRFEPAPAGDRMFGVESPFVAGEATPHVAMIFDYGHNPYVLRHGPGLTDVGAVVGDQLVLHLNASMAILHRVNLNFSVPAAVVLAGNDPESGGKIITSPKDAAFGDMRGSVRVRVFGDYEDPFQLAVSGTLWFPTGAENTWMTDGKLRGMPSLIMGGHLPALNWTFSAGVLIRPKQTLDTAGLPSASGVIVQGSGMMIGGGVGFLFADGKAQIGPEFRTSFVFSKVDRKNTNAELLLGARYRIFDDFEIGAGAGPGLTAGVGTPDVRIVGMLAFTPKVKPPAPPDKDNDGVPDAEDMCPDTAAPRAANPQKPGCPAPADRDGDGVADDVDACPDQAGPAQSEPGKNGCPADKDHDGVPDAVDACPDQAGVASADPKKNGCPPPQDSDGDGITDDIDACPNYPGMKSEDPKQNGCPGDRDGDGVRDDQDACPDVKGVKSADPKRNGCPRAAVSQKQIDLNEEVEFDTGTAKIRPSSDALLEEVAGILKAHPELTRIEVQGHTDNQGAKAANKQLSQQRADAVKKALVARGIEARRLTTKGYGEDQPLADNATDEGRAKNRRVQFVILESAGNKAPPAKVAAPKAAPPKAPAPQPKKK